MSIPRRQLSSRLNAFPFFVRIPTDYPVARAETTMRQEIADLVYPVLTSGVRLRDRLAVRGQTPDIDAEQAALKRLLLGPTEAGQWADFGGDEKESSGSSMELRLEDNPRRGEGRFLGIRFALVCWLDELFILDSPWKTAWNEKKLEVDLYGSNDRAWRFWEQARMAEGRSTPDAHEVFYLCVMLGFRGELREQRDQLRAWVRAAKARASRIKGLEWPYSLDVTPPTQVPPLDAQARFERMVVVAGAAFLFLLPFVAYYIVHRLGA